jgi:hypothetical protein
MEQDPKTPKKDWDGHQKDINDALQEAQEILRNDPVAKTILDQDNAGKVETAEKGRQN